MNVKHQQHLTNSTLHLQQKAEITHPLSDDGTSCRSFVDGGEREDSSTWMREFRSVDVLATGPSFIEIWQVKRRVFGLLKTKRTIRRGFTVHVARTVVLKVQGTYRFYWQYYYTAVGTHFRGVWDTQKVVVRSGENGKFLQWLCSGMISMLHSSPEAPHHWDKVALIRWNESLLSP